ncbi:MAG TPA: hypothetical protein VMW29_00565 [Candidatus Bathyarchaeia archaeon]|nr:hypothetical protein [Candidatus Bathyarchaeia archaeon]
MLNKKDLSLVGATLYLCEGTKARVDSRGTKNFSVEFTNIDPRTIKIFLEFLRKVIKIDEKRLKAQLFYYPDHTVERLIDYWSKVTQIPKERFTKPIKLIQKNKKYKPNPKGILKIRYHHKIHFLKIQGIINKIFGS